MIHRPQPPSPIDDSLEIIRRAIGEALQVIRPESSQQAFTAIRWLYAAQRAVDQLKRERKGKEDD